MFDGYDSAIGPFVQLDDNKRRNVILMNVILMKM